MMKLLTEDAVLTCAHEILARVQIKTTQNFVRLENRRVLVEGNPAGKIIKGCFISTGLNQPCTKTEAVKEGYSNWICIEGQPVCLDTVTGWTNGDPPKTVKYKVYRAGQTFVSEVK